MSDYETILAQFRSAQIHHAEGRLSDALALYDAILQVKPDLAEVYSNRGVVLRDLLQFEEALESFNKTIEINPELAEAYNNKGYVLTELGRLSEALAALDQAIALKPDFPDAHNNRGVALRRMNRLDEALKSYDRAIALDDNYGEAWSNRGEALAALQQLDAAIAGFERALALMPQHADTLLNTALALQKKGRFREARHLLERAQGLAPTHKRLLFALAYGALQHCEWPAQEALRERMMSECPTGKSIVPPLALLGYLTDPNVLRQASARYLLDLVGPAPFEAARPALIPHDKIRLAYVSGDFHEHATAYLMADLFEHHDRACFEVHGVSFGPDDHGPMRQRLTRAFDQFHDAQASSDGDVVALMRRLEVDIAIDLKGFTAGERPGIFVRRAAPLQVNYLGYPGTMAADCWDYIIADNIVLPRAEQPFYSEQIVHLGCCYQVNDPARPIAAPPSRASQGLPETGFVFCCFNNHSKITQPVFEVWMRLLKALPDSVLWLLDGQAGDTLRHEAHARGIDPRRLIFAPLASQQAHLGRLGLADLVLDTLPYNAHTTASDALWAGVPLVTCRGKAFAGRVAASLLSAMELPELIAQDLTSYEALALKLARDRAFRDALRSKLAANRGKNSLFDADKFRRNIESAFLTMVEKARRGEAPAPFDVTI
jgi:predicted O-linked N-acetylglucosamine transferase (SPINDLY family)